MEGWHAAQSGVAVVGGQGMPTPWVLFRTSMAASYVHAEENTEIKKKSIIAS